MANFTFCQSDNQCGAHSLGCGSDGKCVCNPLWSTDMDFVSFETCATSVIAMYVLWALNIVEIVWVIYKSAWVILARFENFFEQRRVKRGYTLLQNKGLIAVIAEFAISIPAQLTMAVLHMVLPTVRIGFDLFPTMLFFLAKLGFYISTVFLQGPMLAVTLRGDPNKKKIVQMGYFANILAAILSIIIGALPFAIYNSFSEKGQEKQQLAVMQAYYFCQGSAMCINAVMARVIIRKVNEALGKADTLTKGNDAIRKKVNTLQYSVMTQATLQGIVYIIMGAVPFFWVYHAYFLPISWLAMPLLGKKLAHQVNLDKRGTKTIMQRLGIVKVSMEDATTKDETPGVVSPAVYQSSNPTHEGASKLHPLSSGEVSVVPSSSARERPAYLRSAQSNRFEELMNPDHPQHSAFMEFVRTKHATAEVELFQSCLNYRDATTSKERTRIGRTIMSKFIEDGAPYQVDIPESSKDIIVSTAKKGMFVESTFDSIRRQLAFDLGGNFNAQFERRQSNLEEINQ